MQGMCDPLEVASFEELDARQVFSSGVQLAYTGL